MLIEQYVETSTETSRKCHDRNLISLYLFSPPCTNHRARLTRKPNILTN